MIETTVAERRKLDSERQRKETEDQRKAREASLTVQINFLNVMNFF
jgi:Wiskott-Aldrich syndrome protein